MQQHGWDIYGSEPAELAELMELAEQPQNLWRSNELGAVLRHQLHAPVGFDLGGLEAAEVQGLRPVGEGGDLLINSFADLFHHPHPPLGLLRLVKQFAKANRAHPDSPLPVEVAALLYLLSIAVARLRCGERISSLDDDALREGLKWASEQCWLDNPTRSLITEAMDSLGARGQGL